MSFKAIKGHAVNVIVPQFFNFSQETGRLHWLQSMDVFKC